MNQGANVEVLPISESVFHLQTHIWADSCKTDSICVCHS